MLFSCSVLAERHDIHAEADRPGMGTGTNILDRGSIQWETGFEAAHLMGMHELTLPTVLFRFGLSEWAELRLEYTGILAVDDKPYEINTLPDAQYIPEPLWVGSKIRLWQGSEQPNLRWIPRTSLLLNLGVPLTKFDAEYHPISGSIDFLFENDITDWFTIGYDVCVDWVDWAPTPDVFASLAFNFTPTEKLGVSSRITISSTPMPSMRMIQSAPIPFMTSISISASRIWFTRMCNSMPMPDLICTILSLCFPARVTTFISVWVLRGFYIRNNL